MNLLELFMLAVALSMDALAVAICVGLTMTQSTFKKMLIVGLYFGIFQGVMPLIGYFITSLFADSIISYNHWAAFVLLGFLGVKMIYGSSKKEGCSDNMRPSVNETSLSPAYMLPFAVATSIDALAVGVSFAFLKVNIFPAVLFIGIITLVLSMAGVKIGNIFGLTYKSKAELFGGVILILIGLKILIEHL